MLQSNEIVGGIYRVIKPIGHGGAGTIYLAIHLHLNKYVVLKRVHTGSGDVEKFRRESDILKNLHLIRTSGNPALKIPLPMDRIQGNLMQGNLMQGKLMKKEILLPENMVQEKLPRKKALRTVLIPVLRIRKA